MLVGHYYHDNNAVAESVVAHHSAQWRLLRKPEGDVRLGSTELPKTATEVPSLWRHAAQFVVPTLIWGSTWLVIRKQVAQGAVPWAVAYRFVIAAVGLLRKSYGSIRSNSAGVLTTAIEVGEPVRVGCACVQGSCASTAARCCS